MLQRVGIVLKRGRSYVHSPDPYYEEKLKEMARIRTEVEASQGKQKLLYMDEFGYARQPLPAPAYEEGKKGIQPLAKRSTHKDTETRVVGAIENKTGQLIYRSANKIRIATLVGFLKQVREAYPEAERIYLVQDNWPVHVHPDVLVALEKQETKFERKCPKNWPSTASEKAKKKYGNLNLAIQLVPLPTYASWANPIEKVWRKLRQEVLHQHKWAEDVQKLKEEVNGWLDKFKEGSLELLRYVGL